MMNSKLNNNNELIIFQIGKSSEEEEEEEKNEQMDKYLRDKYLNNNFKSLSSTNSTNNSNEKKRFFTQTRRDSVFSKTYDPEINQSSSKQTTTQTTTLTTNHYLETNIETIKNKQFEYEDEEKKKLNSKNKIEDVTKRAYMKRILSSIVLFRHLLDEDLDNIIDSMFERKCCKDEIIIKQGDTGYYLYIILNGLFDVYIKTRPDQDNKDNKDNKYNDQEYSCPNTYGKKVLEYKNSGFFGELALLYNQPRSATVISKCENGLLACMNRDKFQELVISISFNKRKKYVEFLDSMPLLKSTMNEYERSQVADALITYIYKAGDCIFKQNDIANGMYFIESGCIEIVNENETSNLKNNVLNRLKMGDYFGELALVNKSPRTASAYVSQNSQTCKLAFLEVDAFERLMGPCIKLFKHNLEFYKI